MFTGGAGTAVAFAAVSAANGDDEDDEEPETEVIAGHGVGCGCAACCGHDEVVLPDGSVQVTHVVYVDLPAVDFDYDSFDTGDDVDGEADIEDSLFA